MIKYIKEHKDKILVFIIFLLVFLFLISKIISEQVSNLDELWNYNIARNVAKGLIPYKDISLITTPFLPIIEGMIIKITFDELVTFRIMNAILLTLITFLSYRILYKLSEKRIISSIASLTFLVLLNKDLFLDYNFFILFLVLIIINLELSNQKKTSKKFDYLIGFLGGLAFCTKQTVGAIICVEITIIKIGYAVKEKNYKCIIRRMLGIAIPVILLIAYLLITKSFDDFLSYTILSIGTFDNSIPYKGLLLSEDVIIRILSYLLPSFIVGMSIYFIGANNKKSEIYSQIYTVFCNGMPLLLIEYPIFDRVHFILANYVMIIIVLFLVTQMFKILLEKISFIKYITYFKIVGISFIVLFSITKMSVCLYEEIFKYISNEKNNELNHYNGLIVSNYVKQMYYELKQDEEKYEQQGKQVNILDSYAVIIHIPMDKYIKNYDMFNKGNFGKKGEDGIIEKIKSEKNQVYLIKKDSLPKNWQNPDKVTEYVVNNCKKIDENSLYDFYE